MLRIIEQQQGSACINEFSKENAFLMHYYCIKIIPYVLMFAIFNADILEMDPNLKTVVYLLYIHQAASLCSLYKHTHTPKDELLFFLALNSHPVTSPAFKKYRSMVANYG